MATYQAKIRDSFTTKLRMFFFEKAFKEKSFAECLKNEDLIIQEFKIFNSKVLTYDFVTSYSNNYFNGFKDNEICVKINNDFLKKTQEELENILKYSSYAYFSKDNQNKLLGKSLYNKLFEIYKTYFSVKFTKEEFQELVNTQVCSYCGISDKYIELMKNKNLIGTKSGRGRVLEIDRKYPNLEYTKDNCCMSCYWCNNAKTDEYIPSEFKEIAKGINHVWNERLEKVGITEKIIFPDESNIWKDA